MAMVPSAHEAIADLLAGQTVFVHGGAATPTLLLEAMRNAAERLRNVKVVHLHTEGTAVLAGHPAFRIRNLFVGGNMRRHLNFADNDYIPCFLSEIPSLFRSGRLKLDVALLQLSPPDEHGFCTLGTSVDIARAAAESARMVIAHINPQMPRIHGDGFIHVRQLHAWFEADRPLPEAKQAALSETELQIGKHVASLVPDGACLQSGIGSIPDACLRALAGHKDLGLHTEMWSDGALELIEKGVINNRRKIVHPGKSVSSFTMGSRRLYDFIDDNPSVIQLEASYVNNTSVIARNPDTVAINSAVEIDMTGQVCADSIGCRVISGVGGQMDFIRGASLSERGKPIIALPARTKHGQSRIVPTLQMGAGVVTTRAHVHYVVTEYGIADLVGRSIGERAKLLAEIAHPDDRENLLRQFHAAYTQL